MASKETSSSSGVLFAKPTKTWDLPQRARPGRKPKVSSGGPLTALPPPSVVSSATHAPITSLLTSATSNRDAQKNFRLRQREHLASLETRIAAYERNEIQSNIALQQTARAMKEENDRLKLQVAEVQEGRVALEEVLRREREERGVLEVQMKRLKSRLASLLKESRARQDAGAASGSGSGSGDRQGRSPAGTASGSSYSGLSPAEIILSMSHTPPSQQTYTTVATNPTRPSLISTPSSFAHPHPHAHTNAIGSTSAQQSPSGGPSTACAADLAEELACGFCQGQASICMCKVVADQAEEDHAAAAEAATILMGASPMQFMARDNARQSYFPALVQTLPQALGSSGIWRSDGPVYANQAAPLTLSSSSSIMLTYIPPVEQAIPLPRGKKRREGEARAESDTIILPLAVAPVGSKLGAEAAECTGDPRNCPACKDDAFGKEFCETLSKSDPQYLIARTTQQLKQTVPAGCSGDPANCTACQDDSFGREFCETLTRKVPSKSPPMRLPPLLPSADAPGSKITLPPIVTPDFEFDAIFDTACCGNAELCGATHETCSDAPAVVPVQPSPYATSTERHTIRADEAWKTLKAHPNARFASLQLLAEVVAKGTTWLSSTSPEIEQAPKLAGLGETSMQRDTMQLVPIEALVASGRKRKLEIHPEAVQEALAMLDAVPGHAMKRRRLSDIRDAY